ncbi:MAG: lamin tail domain-containing protein [Mycobacteriales bacterium]
MHRKRLVALPASIVIAAGVAVLAVSAPASAASPDVTISQVYGGGGNSGATLTNDFVELDNHGPSAVDLSGWSVQYASGTGSSWQVTPLSGSVPVGAHYLIAEAAGSGGSTPRPTPDATGAIPTSATAGKIALVENAAALTCGTQCAAAAGVHDFVGYCAANDAEGAHPAPAPSNTTADVRAAAGATDTDDNAADFSTGSPDPRNTGGGGGGGGGGTTGLAIHDIQGATHVSPYVGTKVLAVPGVVTAVGVREFWMQDPQPDRAAATSEGIAVYSGSAPAVAVGDSVTVDATVTEYRPSANDLSTTELSAPTVTVIAHGVAVPAPTLVGLGGRVPPSRVIESGVHGSVETSGTFNPGKHGIDFWESLEGMRVELGNAQVVGPTNRFGETTIVPRGSTVRTTRGGIVAQSDDFNPERVVLTSTLADVPAANVGDRFPGATVGVIDYAFDNFELIATTSPTLLSGGLQRQVATPATDKQLAVATFNVENLAPSDPQSKFDTLAQYALTNLAAPDILALEEIQDNDGATDDGVVAADVTLQKLTGAITAAGGPTYQWAQIDPANDQDGGQPGGNIRQVFLYRTDRGLAFVHRGTATATAPTAVAKNRAGAPYLTLSPGRIDPTDAAWANSRKPLAGQFSFDGQTVFVIANHFDAKLGDQPLFGRYQPPATSSATQRVQQATLVRRFVNQIEGADPKAAIAVVGDLNDFDFSATTKILTRGEALVDLPSTLPITQRYTYVYQGNSEVLDHILLSPALSKYHYQVVHINSEFADQISDHEPQVVRLDIG